MSGGYFIEFKKVFAMYFNENLANITKMDKIVFFDIRIPRIITAIIVGIALSIAGATYQSC